MAIVSNVSGDYFWDVVRRPIRFRETAARLEGQRGRHYIDIGPSGTLATFLKYSLPARTSSSIHAILTPFGGEQINFESLTATLSC
jgi:hypothetical protein